MRKGIDLLRDSMASMDADCGCDRPRCPKCKLRREIEEYLEVATNGRPEGTVMQ